MTTLIQKATTETGETKHADEQDQIHTLTQAIAWLLAGSIGSIAPADQIKILVLSSAAIAEDVGDRQIMGDLLSIARRL